MDAKTADQQLRELRGQFDAGLPVVKDARDLGERLVRALAERDFAENRSEMNVSRKADLVRDRMLLGSLPIPDDVDKGIRDRLERLASRPLGKRLWVEFDQVVHDFCCEYTEQLNRETELTNTHEQLVAQCGLLEAYIELMDELNETRSVCP